MSERGHPESGGYPLAAKVGELRTEASLLGTRLKGITEALGVLTEDITLHHRECDTSSSMVDAAVETLRATGPLILQTNLHLNEALVNAEQHLQRE